MLIRKTPAVFKPLMAPARYKGAKGGRGSGKSHFFAEMMVEACLLAPGTRAVCVREVQKSLKDSSKRLIEDKIKDMGVGAHFTVKLDSIDTPGGGIITFQGLQDHTAQSIKSLEGFRIAWCEEAQTLSETSLELLRPTIRSPGSELWFSWNPRSKKDPTDQLFMSATQHPSMTCVTANWSDNPFFGPELQQERLHDQRTKPQRYAHIWEGAYEPHNPDAIWDWESIAGNRIGVHQAPKMGRIVIAIDPAVSNSESSDEHGIAAVGVGEDGRGYLLADYSCRGGPTAWAKAAVAAYNLHEANAIVVERNQGGDMCKHTLRTVDRNVKIIEVTATRGKHIRAEPIASLYTLGKISHVGTFPEIEEQMMSFSTAGYTGEGSPDRAEAVIWGFSQLFPTIGKVNQAHDWRDQPSRGAGNGQQGWMS